MKLPIESKEWHKTGPGCWERTVKEKDRRYKKGFHFHSIIYQEIICGNCSTLGLARKSRIDEGYGRFCSPECAAKGKNVKGNNNPHWKGGRIIDGRGYVLLKKPYHPNADKHGYIRESRLIASGMYGRPIAKGEIVHHMNQNRADNSQINLVVLTIAEHNAVHARSRRLGQGGI